MPNYIEVRYVARNVRTENCVTIELSKIAHPEAVVPADLKERGLAELFARHSVSGTKSAEDIQGRVSKIAHVSNRYKTEKPMFSIS